MGKVIEVSDGNFVQEVKDFKGTVLVDFWAPWCGPCRMVSPVVEEIAGLYDGKMKVVKVNVDENRATAMEYGVMSIPTLIIFKDGVKVDAMVGYQPKEVLAEKINRVL